MFSARKISTAALSCLTILATLFVQDSFASGTITSNTTVGTYGHGGAAGNFSNAHGRNVSWSNGWRAEWRLTGSYWYHLRDYGSFYPDYDYLWDQTYTLRLYDETGTLVDSRSFWFWNGQAEVQWRNSQFYSFTDINFNPIGTDDVVSFNFTRRSYPGTWRWDYNFGGAKMLANREKVNVSQVTWNGNSGMGPLRIYDYRISSTEPIKEITARENTPGGCSSFYPGYTPDAYYEGIEDAGTSWRVKIRHASYCSQRLESYLLEKDKFSVCQLDSNFCSEEEMQANWIFNDRASKGNMSHSPSSGTDATFGQASNVRNATTAAVSEYPLIPQWYANYGLQSDSFAGTSAKHNVDFSAGTAYPKEAFRVWGQFYGWYYATREKFGAGLSSASFDSANPIPSIRWKRLVDDGFVSAGAEWAAYASGMPLYPIRNSWGEVLAYVQFPSGNLLCRTAGCRELKPLDTAGVDTGYVRTSGNQVFVRNSITATWETSVPVPSEVSSIRAVSASPDGSLLMVASVSNGTTATYVAKSLTAGFSKVSTFDFWPAACPDFSFPTDGRYSDGSISWNYADWCDPLNVRAAIIVRKNGTYAKAYPSESGLSNADSGGSPFDSQAFSRDGLRVYATSEWGNKFVVANAASRTVAFSWTNQGDWSSPENQFYRIFSFASNGHELWSRRNDYSTNEVSFEKWSENGEHVTYPWKVPMGISYAFLIDEKKAVYKDSGGKVWVLDVVSGTRTESPITLFTPTSSVVRWNSVVGGYLLSYWTAEWNVYGSAIKLSNAAESKILTQTTPPSGMDFVEGRFRNPELISKSKVEKSTRRATVPLSRFRGTKIPYWKSRNSGSDRSSSQKTSSATGSEKPFFPLKTAISDCIGMAVIRT